jgi:hypothetical protein
VALYQVGRRVLLAGMDCAKRLLTIGALLVAFGVTLVACNGSTSMPPPVITPANFSVTSQTAFNLTPGGGPTTIPLPTGGGFAGGYTIAAPVAPAQGTLTITIQNAPPTDVAALSVGRLPQSDRRSLSQIPHTTLLYIKVVSDQVLQLPGSPTFSLSIPSADIIAGATYYLAFFDNQNLHDWNLAWEGPATVSGTTLTFSANGLGSFTFQPNVNYWFALVAIVPNTTPSPTPTGGATPSPTPTPAGGATPTPTPTPVGGATPTPAPTPTPPPLQLTVQPNPVNVYGTGAGNAQTITVHETAYNGPFTESDTCAGKATISSANANGPDATYTVTGVSAVTCTATFTDAFNQHIATQVIVTTSGWVIN